MTRTLHVELKDVYGQTKAYPVCTLAHQFADLLGTRTLTGAALRRIEEMGVEIIGNANRNWRAAA